MTKITILDIIDETIRLREAVNLPMRFIVLAEPPESLIVLDTKNIPSVIWFDTVDISRIEESHSSQRLMNGAVMLNISKSYLRKRRILFLNK